MKNIGINIEAQNGNKEVVKDLDSILKSINKHKTNDIVAIKALDVYQKSVEIKLENCSVNMRE